ncbi:MAG: hypothetical protein J7K98_01740 [Candidatus Aenigmarchaeota archaeon]|nr:hypothetical protein [Candidatus Aenigmarchaeota archaeon]
MKGLDLYGSTTTSTVPQTCPHPNGKCELGYGETQENCPRDCPTIISVIPQILKPNEIATIIIYFNDSRFTLENKHSVSFDLKIYDLQNNLVVNDWRNCFDNVVFNIEEYGVLGCDCDLNQMTCQCSEERMYHRDSQQSGRTMSEKWEKILYKNSKIYATPGFFKITAYCRIPSYIKEGKYKIWVQPFLHSKEIKLRPAVIVIMVRQQKVKDLTTVLREILLLPIKPFLLLFAKP